jgi:hypothetical protein
MGLSSENPARFHLRSHVDRAILPREALARRLIVRPASSTIVHAGDVFSVRESWFRPIDESGAIVGFEVETGEPWKTQTTVLLHLAERWKPEPGVGFKWIGF